MKKTISSIILIIIFTVLTVSVKFCTQLTLLDRTIEQKIQEIFAFIPIKYPVFADKTGYLIMLFSGLIAGTVYFAAKRNWKQILLFLSLPLFSYCLNVIIKNIIQRTRPDFDLQISWIHPSTFSYVSSHTLITFCLFGMIAYYFYKTCKTPFIKYTGIILSVLWISVTGLSRILIGVHYPTDILGACILGCIVLIFYTELSKFVERA